jgi:hypothetical protein
MGCRRSSGCLSKHKTASRLCSIRQQVVCVKVYLAHREGQGSFKKNDHRGIPGSYFRIILYFYKINARDLQLQTLQPTEGVESCSDSILQEIKKTILSVTICESCGLHPYHGQSSLPQCYFILSLNESLSGAL